MQRRGRQARPPNVAYREAFGVRLQALRAERDISQEALANATGVARRYVSGIERGEANPTLDVVVLLADGLGLEPADLLPPRDHGAGGL